MVAVPLTGDTSPPQPSLPSSPSVFNPAAKDRGAAVAQRSSPRQWHALIHSPGSESSSPPGGETGPMERQVEADYQPSTPHLFIPQDAFWKLLSACPSVSCCVLRGLHLDPGLCLLSREKVRGNTPKNDFLPHDSNSVDGGLCGEAEI